MKQENQKHLVRCVQRRATQALFACVITIASTFTQAHELGWSYVFVHVEPDGLSGRLELPFDQVANRFNADADGSGVVEQNELDAIWPALEKYALNNLTIGDGQTSYPVTITKRDRLDIEVTNYAVLEFDLDAPSPVPHNLAVKFAPFFEQDDTHRGALVIENNYLTGVKDNHRVMAAMFAPGRLNDAVDLRGEPVLDQAWRFVVEGVWHIWIGIDHVLFLITLLLIAVLVRDGAKWIPAADSRTAFINLFKVITLFTIAHSITLALALKGWVRFPSQLVESIIALSVIVVAANNIRPFLANRLWGMVFIFGLFHGLGFASVLQSLVVSFQSKLISLVAFNVGVEIGQLAIVAVVFPILFWIRDRDWYLRGVVPVISGIVALVGLWWFITRAFGIESPISSF